MTCWCAQVRKFGEALLRAAAPVSLSEWQAATRTLQRAVPKTPGLQKPTAYRSLWVIRAWLDFLMRQEGNWVGLTCPSTAKVGCDLKPNLKPWHLHLIVG